MIVQLRRLIVCSTNIYNYSTATLGAGHFAAGGTMSSPGMVMEQSGHIRRESGYSTRESVHSMWVTRQRTVGCQR